jgi:hypothetical protein
LALNDNQRSRSRASLLERCQENATDDQPPGVFGTVMRL